MKNKILILAFVIAGLLYSCSSDVYEAPNSFSDVGFYTSNGQTIPLRVNIDRFMTFSDLSQNATSHKWTIGDGNIFLEGSIKTTDTIFDKFMVSGMDTISSTKTVSVLFKKDGLQKVHLHNTFKDSVAFRGYNALTKTNYIKPAIKVGNEWVMDTIFMVDVYAKIVPVMELRQNGVLIDHTKKDTIYVEAGDVLNFKDLTTIGRPTTRYFSIVKALKEGVVQTAADVVGSSSAADATIIFKKLGNFNAFLTSSRSGQNIPSASKKYTVASPIKVIPSSKPFVLTGTIKEQEDETLQIPFNGEFAAFLGQESFFTVKVNGVTFSVKSVKVNALDSTILDLVLNAKIYRPDVITVSYSGGSLTSTDTRSLVAFADKPVVMHDVNLLSTNLAGFEDGGGAWTKYYAADGTADISTEKSFAGNFGAKLALVTGQKEASISTPTTGSNAFPVILNKSGANFVVTWKMFITPESVTTGKSMGLFRFPSWAQSWVDLNAVKKGEWVTMTAEFNVATITGLYLRILDGTKTSNLTVYYDDFKIVEKEVRP